MQESEYVFLKMGLEAWLEFHGAKINQPIRVFEMGLGTGLNCLLTWLRAEKMGLEIDYTAVEAFPLLESEWKALNYGSPSGSEFQQKLASIHSLEWNKRTILAEKHKPPVLDDQKITAQRNYRFSLEKVEGLLEEYLDHPLKNKVFDLIYFDAFAPDTQPELWTETVFSKLYDRLNPGGILTTYCAKGSVKRTLRAVGFMVEPLPGPPRKREMTRCRKPGEKSNQKP